MNLNLIAEARGEAERFLHRVKDYEASKYTPAIGEKFYTSYGVKESGALRRASMDLTRALARMRSYKV